MDVFEVYRHLRSLTADAMHREDYRRVKAMLREAERNGLADDEFGLNPLVFDLQTAVICAEEVGLSRAAVLAIMLHRCPADADYEGLFGSDVAKILRGYHEVMRLYAKNPSIETENFRNLLLEKAGDMRVIFIIIADCVNLMRQIKDRGTDEARQRVATAASRLYAPLAHKLGLYLIKSELEDLSLKYLEHDAYYLIKDKLSETKRSRDAYIQKFIQPIEQRLQKEGLKFHVKGRTKSIHSIWQKMKKQKCAFEGIYDLFAIRIIIDCPLEEEKKQCWQVFSIVTDMYTPNPRRLRDWLSVPKSNGYESLHITVMGPEGKWVEIQIRTERMDEVAERGLAAHWRYKGVKGDSQSMEQFLQNVREALEMHDVDDSQLSTLGTKLDDEIFVFTPRGDLFKLPKGATVLDFAYKIHTSVGQHCAGGRINGKNVPMRMRLQSGDQVEILTNQNQQPKRDWLNFAITSRARTKIKQSLNEQEAKTTTFAKETLERKFKNKKIDYDEATMMRLIKRLNYKHVTDFYRDIADEVLDPADVIEKYQEQQRRDAGEITSDNSHSASDFQLSQIPGLQEGEALSGGHADTLIIDKNVSGVEYSLARCCNPIYGDRVFGFVTAGRGIKIHRMDCPNALRLRNEMPYRIIPARWAGKGSSLYPITLRVVGRDQIGIVNNLTSIISKEQNVMLRSIEIHSSEDGLFSGTLTIQIDDLNKLKTLIKKLQTVKGVKQVTR